MTPTVDRPVATTCGKPSERRDELHRGPPVAYRGPDIPELELGE